LDREIKPQKLNEQSELANSENLVAADTAVDMQPSAAEIPDATKQILAAADHVLGQVLTREDPNIGKIIGGMYRIESRLGAGGMSVVYKAEHLLLQRQVVIKFIAHERIADAKTVMRFAQEAKASAVLSHPNVVATREFGVTEDGQPYIVMDFVDGTPLSTLLENQAPLKPERAIELTLQVCEGLRHAHEKGIVHRDIKPGNIVIEKEGTEKESAKIVDFGIAKDTTQQAGQTLTQTGEVFGSPLYMSPEQCAGRSVDARSDIYSLGCVLCEMLTGSPPHQGKNVLETMMLHMTAEAPEFKNLPPDLENILVRALERDLTKRYQSITEMQRALESASLGGGRRAIRRRRRPFFTRTRIIVYCSIAIVSASLAALCAGISVYQSNAWSQTLADGEKMALQGNTILAEHLFDKALTQAQKSESWNTAQIEIHQAMGDMYNAEYAKEQRPEDFNKAFHQYATTYDAAIRGGNEFQKAHIAEKLGDIYRDSKDFARAERFYDEALIHRIKDAGPESYVAAVTEHRQGLNYAAEGKYKLAEQKLLHAVKIYTAIGDDDNKGYAVAALNELAENAARAQRKEKALSYYDQAIALARSCKKIDSESVQQIVKTRDELQQAKKP